MNENDTKMIYQDLVGRIQYWAKEGGDISYFEMLGILDMIMDDLRLDYRLQLDEEFPLED